MILCVHIEVDGNKILAYVELLTREVKMHIRSKIHYIKKISVIPHSLTLSTYPSSDPIQSKADLAHKQTKRTNGSASYRALNLRTRPFKISIYSVGFGFNVILFLYLDSSLASHFLENIF